MNDDTSLIWEFLNLRREQQRLSTTIIRNELIGVDRSYNLLLSHFSRERTRNSQTPRSRSFRDTMTGILWDELSSDPSLNNLINNMSSYGSGRTRPRTRRNFSGSRPNYIQFDRQRRTATNNSSFLPPLRSTAFPTTNTIGGLGGSNTRLRIPRVHSVATQTLINPLFTQFSRPTRVLPTNEQITNMTEELRFSDLSTNEVICAITRSDFEPDDIVLKLRRCGHFFKKEPLKQWFARNSTCPVCRDNILISPAIFSTRNRLPAPPTIPPPPPPPYPPHPPPPPPPPPPDQLTSSLNELSNSIINPPRV